MLLSSKRIGRNHTKLQRRYTSGSTHIKYYYDVVSPWSYIGLHILSNAKKKLHFDLALEPFFLGGIMQTTGNKPPISLPAKGKYQQYDLLRSSKFYNVPLGQPSNFPVNTIKAQRVLTYVKQNHPEVLGELTFKYSKYYWGGLDLDITNPLILVQGLEEVGLNEEQVSQTMDAISTDQIKGELLRVTSEAIEDGAFGAPWSIITSEK
eukprot:TRINITY_DN1959_c0_g1_i4.p1 TRINITY_DN1959_c0_g1~~TRINITY_DN1959_c0_g1_i4.p1  ORF type:complete len:207 (+),score=27.06 TRINITY_DN1959_c0_g1_i4:52-672(+)